MVDWVIRLAFFGEWVLDGYSVSGVFTFCTSHSIHSCLGAVYYGYSDGMAMIVSM